MVSTSYAAGIQVRMPLVATPYEPAKSELTPTLNPRRARQPQNLSTAVGESPTKSPINAAARAQSLRDAVAPLLETGLSEPELRSVKETILAYKRGKTKQASNLARAVRDPVARKLIRWYALRGGSSGASGPTIEKFRRDNPHWTPNQIREAAEQALLFEDASPQVVFSIFDKEAPHSGAGKAALAVALNRTGEKSRAKKLTIQAWREHRFGKRVEDAIVARLGDFLGESDHRFRFDTFLLQDSRWKGTRNRRIAAAKRMTKHLSSAERKKANARIAVYRRSRGASAAFAKLPKSAMKDWGVYFQKIQLLRRQKKDAQAWRMMLAAPTASDLVVSPDDWWVERRVLAYRALYAKAPKTAYRLVANPGAVSVNPRNESEFMAGWIALRFLKDAKTAEKHFRTFTESADGPRTRSSAAYWLGRALEAQGQRNKSKEQYRLATGYFNTFYGQLARQRLSPSSRLIRIAAPAIPSQAIVMRFRSREIVRASVIAMRAGLSNVTRTILSDLRYRLSDPGELVLLAQLAQSLGDTQMSVRIGKTGLGRGHNLVHFAYPIHAMPSYKPLRTPPEKAILYSIARQESEFNTLIRSGAGARGILQVMPGTAKHICRQYRIRCNIGALNANPAYNTKLASAYIGDRLDEFSGSYIMTFAGYNAGPGRVRGWVRQNGDPRHRHVDPVDWIELIHIKETREYVKKVMANVQVYRSRLGEEENALRINDDIMRARQGTRRASSQ